MIVISSATVYEFTKRHIYWYPTRPCLFGIWTANLTVHVLPAICAKVGFHKESMCEDSLMAKYTFPFYKKLACRCLVAPLCCPTSSSTFLIRGYTTHSSYGSFLTIGGVYIEDKGLLGFLGLFGTSGCFYLGPKLPFLGLLLLS